MYVNKELNGIESRLLTFGDPFKRSSEIIVFITGSPGIPEFYTEFAQQLHCDTRLPVCVVGHAGHDSLQNLDNKTEANPSSFNLDNQIEHKLDFLHKHIDPSTKVHIVAHSLGAWMLVELINKNDYLIERILSVNLLFPTLQKFSETTNGRNINNFVRRLPGLVLFLFVILEWMPECLRLFFIKLYLIIKGYPSHYVKRIRLYLDPVIQKHSIDLACESLNRIKGLNRGGLNKVKHLTNVVYSLEDGWVPMHHIEDLKNIPQLILEEVNVEHAFILKYSVLVGNIVGRLMRNRTKMEPVDKKMF